MRHPHCPMTEIRERYDGMLADAQHLLKNTERITHLLQRLAQDHHVETLVRVIAQSTFKIALIDGDAARDCLSHFRSIDLDASCIDVLVFPEPRQQFTFAATEVENARRGRNHAGNHRVVAARQYMFRKLFGRFRRHRCTSRYTLSKNPRTISVCSFTSTRNA